MKYIDSHCHLPKTESFSDVFTYAQTKGIAGCVLNAVNESDWNQIVNIASENTKVCGALGIHPWFVNSVSNNWDSDLMTLLANNPKLLVGEIGLYKTHDDFDKQVAIFTRALEIAIKYKRTINIHCVHAWDVMLKILKIYKTDLPKVVIHSFDGTQNALDFDADLYFSYSPNIAHPNYKRIRESVQRVPKNRILVESDSSELLPTINSANEIVSLRGDITSDDIFNNAMGVFYNG